MPAQPKPKKAGLQNSTSSLFDLHSNNNKTKRAYYGAGVVSACVLLAVAFSSGGRSSAGGREEVVTSSSSLNQQSTYYSTLPKSVRAGRVSYETNELPREGRLLSTSSSSDFMISCQGDSVKVLLDKTPMSVERECTIYSFGPFNDPVQISCEPSSSLTSVNCDVSPQFLDVNVTSLATVTIHATASDSLTDEIGEVLIKATYDGKVRMDSIAVVISNEDETAQIEPPAEIILDDADLFLLSGQSNMGGHSTSGSSIGNDVEYWNDLLTLFDQVNGQPNVTEKWKEDLLNTIKDIHNANENLNQPFENLRDEIVSLHADGLLDNMRAPLELGNCSFVDPTDTPSTPRDVSGGIQPTSEKSNCGFRFGHELMFSKKLWKEGQTRNFETAKVARGGSIISEWLPQGGEFWPLLNKTIHDRSAANNVWKGFFWHQGENDAFNENKPIGDTSLTYGGNLTALVNAVRAEMFSASPPGSYKCSEEIPVVIVQIGHWPNNNDAAGRVRVAQAEFTSQDSRASLVIMRDLSQYYHFDATSFLIGGDRIAKAYFEARDAPVICPGAPKPPTLSPTRMPSTGPTSSPTSSPSMKPSVSPVSSSPTAKPTSSPTNSPSMKPSVSPVSSSPNAKPVTNSPSAKPVSLSPSTQPSIKPITNSPTVKAESKAPTTKPVTSEPTTSTPTKKPTPFPTTMEPSSSSPIKSPTKFPSSSPAIGPTVSPSRDPAGAPAADFSRSSKTAKIAKSESKSRSKMSRSKASKKSGSFSV